MAIKATTAIAACAMLLSGTFAFARTGDAPKGDFAYVCTNGDRFTVRFGPADGSATLVRRGETMEMQRQPSDSGLVYAAGNTTITGTAEQLSLNVPGFPPLACQSR